MKSVLHVISGVDPVSGGPVTTLAGMCRTQALMGADVYVAAMMWEDNAGVRQWVEDAASDGVKTTLIGPTKMPMLWHKDTLPTMRELISKVDVVHIHGMWKQIHSVASQECVRQGVPYLIIPHGMLTQDSLGRKILKKRLFMFFKGKQLISNASLLQFSCELERDLSTTFGIEAVVEPNGLDLREFETSELPPDGKLREMYPEIEDRRIVLFLGRLHPIKGLDILIPAFAKANLENTVLVLAGPVTKSYGVKIQEMIESNKLQGRVVLTGMMSYKDRVAAF